MSYLPTSEGIIPFCMDVKQLGAHTHSILSLQNLARMTYHSYPEKTSLAMAKNSNRIITEIPAGPEALAWGLLARIINHSTLHHHHELPFEPAPDTGTLITFFPVKKDLTQMACLISWASSCFYHKYKLVLQLTSWPFNAASTRKSTCPWMEGQLKPELSVLSHYWKIGFPAFQPVITRYLL